ncbi:MAG TPA: Crp/Fnr family transcriptional regulator [Sphingomicrobium sp.]|nr:Crp/Fnr family transcriptional regulator [Sphingomicrobium sp.]
MKHESLKAAGLMTNILHRVVEVQPRRPLRDPGQWDNEGFYVENGVVALFRYSNSTSRRSIVALYFAGELIQPDAGNFGIVPLRPSDVSVISDFGKQPFVQELLLDRARLDASIAREWLAIAGFDCQARVAHLLCEIAVRAGSAPEWMDCQLTQHDIADITSQTSVNVNRVLAELERSGLIERDGRAISFPDWAEICRVASFRPEYLQHD